MIFESPLPGGNSICVPYWNIVLSLNSTTARMANITITMYGAAFFIQSAAVPVFHVSEA
jgi:hypothetical protein